MSQQALFRNEVVRAQRSHWLGAIHLAIPLSFLWLTSLAAALAAAIVLFMVLGHYTRREAVSGRLVPSAGLLGVHSSTVGTVARVYVHQGESVHRGEPLVEISGEHDSAALGSTQALIGAQLRAQAKRFRAQLVDSQQAVEQQAAGLNAKLGLLQQQAAQIDGQIALEEKQVDSASGMLAKLRPLRAKGYVSAFQVEQQEATSLQMQSQVKALRRQQLDTRQQIEQVRQQLAQLPLDLAARQSAINHSISQNDQQLAQNELQRDAVLRAPTDGVVSTLLVKPGQQVSAEQPLLSMLPRGSVLQAQLLVPSSAIGFVERGNEVVMRYQAFPYQKFGQQYGRVINVSRSALSNDELVSVLGARARQPLYRVLVALQHQSINAYGKPEFLKPGMALDADIMLDRRSLWQWAFAPLYGLNRQLAGDRGGRS